MDASRGFVLLARSIDESNIFQNEKWLKVWIWCLVQANHKGKNVPVWIGKSLSSVKVERGQFIFGRKKAAEKLNMPESTVRNIIEMFSKEPFKNLDIRPDRNYSVVTILDFDFWQDPENYKGQPKGQPMDNRWTTDGQPMDTTNKPNTPNTPNKPKKVYSEDSIEFRVANYLYQNILKNLPDYKKPNLQKWADDADKLIRIDKRNIEEIKSVIKWAQSNEFEMINVQSISKLRKRFDQLKLKMIKSKSTPFQKTSKTADDMARQQIEETKNEYLDL